MNTDIAAALARHAAAFAVAEQFFAGINEPDEAWNDAREHFASGAAAYRHEIRRVLFPVDAQGAVAVQRATWVLADPPGPEVTQLNDFEGETWVRHDGDGEMWADPKDPDMQVPWPILLAEYGPLTDSTPQGDPA